VAKKEKKITKVVYPKSFGSKKYPEFIRNSIFLKAFPKPKKAFPKIGLKNCDNALSTVKITGKALQMQLLDKFRSAIEYIQPTNKTVRDRQFEDFDMECSVLCGQLDNDICGTYDGDDDLNKYFSNGNLILPEGIFSFTRFDKSVKLSKNPLISDFAKELIKFCKARHIKCDKLKKLSFTKSADATDVIPASWKNKDLRICFSSENEKGYWDIATMSMRKISSCMRWSSSHAKSLVGSILDPYVGIIYITDGTYTKHGKSMLARAVVRFVVKGNQREPHIMIEKLYPENFNRSVSRIFQSYIEQRINLPVIIADEDDWGGGSYSSFSIPTTEQTESILELEQDSYGHDDGTYLSYRDSGIDYDDVPKFYNPNKIKSFARR